MAANNGNSNNQGVLPPTEILLPPDAGKSVTSGDSSRFADPASAMMGLSSVYAFIAQSYSSKLLPDLPAYWSRTRDRFLTRTIEYDGLWESIVSMAITKAASANFDVEGKDTPVAKVHEMFANANSGEGFEVFLTQHLQDYLLTDNGAFIEIVRVKDNPGARIIGFNHLDSMRCWRTGNTETPVYYQDLENRWHALKWYQVHAISDTPNPRSNFFGVGRCAAGRAYSRIQRRVATQLYIKEKLNPTAPHTLAFPSGINQKQLEEALKYHETTREMQGVVMYGGVAFVPTVSKEGVKIETVPLSELIPNFDVETELKHDVIIMSAAVGMDSQNVMATTNAQLGTGAQSQVLADKEKGKGLVLWEKRWAKFVNHNLTPNNTHYFWVEFDLDEEIKKATLNGLVITNAMNMVTGGLTTPALGTQYLVDEDVLTPEYLPGGKDITPGVSVSDEENPYMLDATATANSAIANPVLPVAAPVPVPPATDANGQPIAAPAATVTAPNAAMPAADAGAPAIPADNASGNPVMDAMLSGEAGVSNVTVLDDNESEDETDQTLTKETAPTGAPKKTGPGSRGGKYWIDAQGKVHYGPKPGYAMNSDEMSNLAPKQVRALNRRSAKADLTDSTTGKLAANLDLMRAKGWFPQIGPGGGTDFGKGSAAKNAAITEAESLATNNPDKMYVVALLKPGNTYAIVSKPINALPPPPPHKKPDNSKAPVAANVGGATRPKPKPVTKSFGELANWTKKFIEAIFD